MNTTPTTILFLCTGNSARSILAEAIANHLGEGRIQAFSAGSHPTGEVNPLAIDTLERHGLPVTGLRSKNWDEFAGAGAGPIDIVITVCDNAAGEVCPVWPGKPTTAHWGLPDPAAASGSLDERRAAFERTFAALHQRLSALLDQPIESLSAEALKQRLADIAASAQTPA